MPGGDGQEECHGVGNMSRDTRAEGMGHDLYRGALCCRRLGSQETDPGVREWCHAGCNKRGMTCYAVALLRGDA